jgi:hypothetical protein
VFVLSDNGVMSMTSNNYSGFEPIISGPVLWRRNASKCGTGTEKAQKVRTVFDVQNHSDCWKIHNRNHE